MTAIVRTSATVLSVVLLAACAQEPTQMASNNLGNQTEIVCKKEAQTGSHRKVMVCHEHGGPSMGSMADRNRIFRLGEMPMSKGQIGH